MEKVIDKNIQAIIDVANTIDYEGRKIKLNGERSTEKDVPDYLLDDCKRIAKILSDYSKDEIPVEMAYDLWSIHSEESFCASFECIDGVSDEVILYNILGLLKVLEIEE